MVNQATIEHKANNSILGAVAYVVHGRSEQGYAYHAML